MRLRWTKLDPANPSGLHPHKRAGDVGFDLEASEDISILAGDHVDVPTNVRVQLPPNCWGEIRARSSIAQRGLQVAATVIDNGYTGHLFVLMYNTHRRENHKDGADWRGRVEILHGERVAQLVLHQGVSVELVQVTEMEDDPRRGPLGFGSTGK